MIKYKNIAIVCICLVLMILNALFYVNTYITEKYEVQLIGIKKDIDPIEIKVKEKKIRNQRTFLIGFSLLLLVVIYIAIRNDDKK